MKAYSTVTLQMMKGHTSLWNIWGAIVGERGHVGWTVGDNRGSTEQKQMAATSGEEARVLTGSTVGMSQIVWNWKQGTYTRQCRDTRVRKSGDGNDGGTRASAGREIWRVF